MRELVYQVRQAWANLKKNTGFVATVVTTMSLALGTLLCVSTLSYILFVSPLPYPNQESLYQLDNSFYNEESEFLGDFFTYPGAVDLHKNSTVFQKTALIFYSSGKIENDPSLPAVQITYVSPEWFAMLSARTELGRSFEQSEFVDTNNPVAVLSYESWQTTFSGDQEILGKKIKIRGVSFKVVGVLSKKFIEPKLHSAGRKTDVFLPWDFTPIRKEREYSWESPHPNISVIGLLNPNLSSLQVEQSISSQVNDLWQDKVSGIEFLDGFYTELKLKQFKEVIVGESKKTVGLLLAAVIGLVLIAIVNISNLYMSRTAEQRRQLAIHAALGASKFDLFKKILAEVGILMSVSILIALLLSWGGGVMMQSYFSERLPRVDELTINWFTLFMAIFVPVCLSFVFALLSVNLIDYRKLKNSLQSSGKGTGIQIGKGIRSALIVSQVAIAGLLIFLNISICIEAASVISKPVGFKTKNVYVLALSSKADSAKEIISLVDSIAKKIEGFPQVTKTSQSMSPLDSFDLIPHQIIGTGENIVVKSLAVDHDYFELLNQPLIEGDSFSSIDVRDQNKYIIVNDVYAKHLSSSMSVVGMKIKIADEKTPSTIKGVVKSATIPGEAEPSMRSYYIFPSDKYRSRVLFATSSNSDVDKKEIISILKEEGARVTFKSIISMEERRRQLLFSQYTTVLTTSILAFISYFLAAIGLFGILNYGTLLRRSELGTRIAIGAKGSDIVRLVLKDNVIPFLIGSIISLLSLILLRIIFTDDLTHFSLIGHLPYMLVTLTLVGSIAMFSCYWPLRKFIKQPVIYSLR